MIQFILILFLLFCNGFFVAAEFSLVRVRVSQLELLANKGNRAAARVIKIVHHLDSYLSAVQLGITIASLGIGWLAEPAINEHLQNFFDWLALPISSEVSHTISFVLAFTFASFAHIVCGELAPKSIAIAKPLEVAMFISMPMRIFHAAFGWVMYLLVITSNALVRLVRIEPIQSGHSSGVSAEELRNIAQHSSNDGTIAKETGTLLENVFQFSALNAREIMVARGQIDAVPCSASVDEFISLALEKGHSRYPIYKTDLDDISGLVHIKDAVAAQKNNPDATLESLMREIVYIPETATIGQVLEKLQQKRCHLAVVVDEYGGTSGLLTIEDALERLVGNIEDEFDPAQQSNIEPAGDDTWSVKGETLLSEISEALDVEEIEAESDTVSGFVMEKLGRVAKLHDKFEFKNLSFEVIAMDRLRIVRVLVHKTHENPPETTND